MQVVGIFLLIVSVWSVYCGVESFNPLLMALAILQNPQDPQSVIAAGKQAVAASSNGDAAPNLSSAAGLATSPAAPVQPSTPGAAPNLGSGNLGSTPSALQSYAFQQLAFKYGITDAADQQALVKLWNEESGWNPNALNKSSGAFGIPQILPSAHPDVSKNMTAQQQIDWGLQYIMGRYGSPSKAWAFETSHSPNWY